MTTRIALGTALALALAGCGSTPKNSGTSVPAVSSGGAGASAPVVMPSAGKPGSGAAGSVTIPMNTGSAGMAALPTNAGVSGASMAGAGRSGSAGMMMLAAGSGGMGAPPAAGNGGKTDTGPDAPFIREADPTEDSLKKNGEYMVKSYTEAMGLVGGTAYGDAAVLGDGAELYYPEGATPPFAAMAIVPGFTAQRSDVAPWGSFLASHGIVSLVIDTNTTGDQPDVRSLALLDAVESLKKENMREGSPIKGKLDPTRIGLMGWSMGGGGTWISADGHPEIKVAVSLCGWIIQSVGSKTSVPSLQLAVSDDELAAGMSQPVYAAIPDSTPKMLVEWLSGGHWTNNNPNNQNKNVGRYGLPWIKVFLEKDERYRQFFKGMPMGASDFKTNQ